MSSGAIAGSAAGGVAALAILAMLVLWFLKRRKVSPAHTHQRLPDMAGSYASYPQQVFHQQPVSPALSGSTLQRGDMYGAHAAVRPTMSSKTHGGLYGAYAEVPNNQQQQNLTQLPDQHGASELAGPEQYGPSELAG